jgi:hypothetical protein
MLIDIGDEARSSMSAADVGTVLGIAHAAGFDRVWIAGGWGVDALVGRQTRIHSDLDLECLSVAQQLRFHYGYAQRERDNHDIALLEAVIGRAGIT